MKPPPAWWVENEPCPDCDQLHPKCSGHVHDEDAGGVTRACQSNPVRGYHRCHAHGGALAQINETLDYDAEISIYAEVKTLMRQCEVATAGRSYVDSLEDALHKANTMVMLLSMLVGTLGGRAKSQKETVAMGTPRERTEWETTSEGMVGPNPDGELATHPWVILYGEWLDRQGRLSKVAADLGLTERQIQVAESQVQMMATTLAAILGDLGLDLHDPGTRKVVERHLLSMQSRSIDVGGSELTAASTAS